MTDRPEQRTNDRSTTEEMGYQDVYGPEDERWSRRWQLRDWMILAVMIAVTIGWNLLVFFLEPGLR